MASSVKDAYTTLSLSGAEKFATMLAKIFPDSRDATRPTSEKREVHSEYAVCMELVRFINSDGEINPEAFGRSGTKITFDFAKKEKGHKVDPNVARFLGYSIAKYYTGDNNNLVAIMGHWDKAIKELEAQHKVNATVHVPKGGGIRPRTLAILSYSPMDAGIQACAREYLVSKGLDSSPEARAAKRVLEDKAFAKLLADGNIPQSVKDKIKERVQVRAMLQNPEYKIISRDIRMAKMKADGVEFKPKAKKVRAVDALPAAPTKVAEELKVAHV